MSICTEIRFVRFPVSTVQPGNRGPSSCNAEADAWAHCGRKKLSPPRASKGPGELHSGESVVRRVERPTTTPPRGGRCGWECFEFEFGLSV